jgi:phage FluMu protein Com
VSLGLLYWHPILADLRRLLTICFSDEPLHLTLEEFAAEGYTHVSCHCPRCRVTRIRPMSWLPKISMGLTLDQLARRLRCAECGAPLLLVKPWRLAS